MQNILKHDSKYRSRSLPTWHKICHLNKPPPPPPQNTKSWWGFNKQKMGFNKQKMLELFNHYPEASKEKASEITNPIRLPQWFIINCPYQKKNEISFNKKRFRNLNKTWRNRKKQRPSSIKVRNCLTASSLAVPIFLSREISAQMWRKKILKCKSSDLNSSSLKGSEVRERLFFFNFFEREKLYKLCLLLIPFILLRLVRNISSLLVLINKKKKQKKRCRFFLYIFY